MPMGIKESANKFAFLHVQDSSEDDEESTPVHLTSKTNGKSSDRRKTQSATTEKKKSKRRRKKNGSSISDGPGKGEADTQLRDWVAKDATLVDELYDEDLRRAIEISKVEYEKNGQSHGETQAPPTFTASNDQVQPRDASPHKKGKKKHKQRKILSLEEFQQRVENSLDTDSVTPPQNELPSTDAKNQPNFFGQVDEAVREIKRREEVKSRYQRRHKEQKTVDDQDEPRDEKDDLIQRLSNENKQLESNFKQVKKRNKQLLVMLQQGEMKEKSELLLEIERLCVLRNELTDEVTSLNQSLEQEKSRSSKYKDEILKLQGKMNEDVGAVN